MGPGDPPGPAPAAREHPPPPGDAFGPISGDFTPKAPLGLPLRGVAGTGGEPRGGRDSPRRCRCRRGGGSPPPPAPPRSLTRRTSAFRPPPPPPPPDFRGRGLPPRVIPVPRPLKGQRPLPAVRPSAAPGPGPAPGPAWAPRPGRTPPPPPRPAASGVPLLQGHHVPLGAALRLHRHLPPVLQGAGAGDAAEPGGQRGHRPGHRAALRAGHHAAAQRRALHHRAAAGAAAGHRRAGGGGPGAAAAEPLGAGGQPAGAGAALRPPGAAVAEGADRPLHRRLRRRRRRRLRRLLCGDAGTGALRLRPAAAGAGGAAVLAQLGGAGRLAGAQPPRRPAPVEADGRRLLPHRCRPQPAAEAAAAAAHPAEGGQVPAEPGPPRGHLPPQAPPGQALRGRRAGPELHPEPARPAAGERERAGPRHRPRRRPRLHRAPAPPPPLSPCAPPTCLGGPRAPHSRRACPFK